MFGLSKQKLMSFNGNMNPHGGQDEKDTLENTVLNDVKQVTESYSLFWSKCFLFNCTVLTWFYTLFRVACWKLTVESIFLFKTGLYS